MRILIASPLFPPDVAAPAPYVKELATRLIGQHHVSLLLYSRFPEAVPGAHFYVIPKNWPTIFKLPLYTLRLFWFAWRHDRILVQNGISTEFPALLISLFFGKKMILQYSDPKVQYTGWRARAHEWLAQRVARTLDHTDPAVAPLSRPEVHPFHQPDPHAIPTYERSWQTHISNLIETTV